MSLLHDMFEEEADKYYKAGDEPDLDEIAERIIGRLQNRPKAQLIEAMKPPVRYYLTTLLRARVSYAERNSPLEHMTPADPTADRMAFLSERFYVPNIGFVTWAQATIDHHLLRIEFLQKKIDGLEMTINRHHEAITLIEGAKVQNLGQVYKPKKGRETA